MILRSINHALYFFVLMVCSAGTQSCMSAMQCRCPEQKHHTIPPAQQMSVHASLKPGPPPPKPVLQPQTPEVIARVRFVATGDVISHGDVLRSASDANIRDSSGTSLNHGGFDELFSEIRDDFKDIDLGFANLETPVAPKSGAKTVPFMFNAPPSLLYALKSLGISMVSFANNHVYDQKRPGLVETLKNLRKAGLTFAGSGDTCAQAQAAKFIEVKGVKIAFLASSMLYNQRLNTAPGKPCASEFRKESVLKEVKKARKDGADLVILSLHWGKEYHTSPPEENVEMAHSLLDGGVDVLLGHHPHVLEPVEVYKASDGRVCIVAYSLGNFLSNQSRYYVHGLQPAKVGNTRDGVLLRFSAVKKAYGKNLTRVELADLTVQPIWSMNNALEYRKDRNMPRIIRPVADDRAAARIQGRLKCARDSKLRIALLKKLKLYLDRRKIAGEILGEDLLGEPVKLPDTQCKQQNKKSTYKKNSSADSTKGKALTPAGANPHSR